MNNDIGYTSNIKKGVEGTYNPPNLMLLFISVLKVTSCHGWYIWKSATATAFCDRDVTKYWRGESGMKPTGRVQVTAYFAPIVRLTELTPSIKQLECLAFDCD